MGLATAVAPKKGLRRLGFWGCGNFTMKDSRGFWRTPSAVRFC